MEDSQVTRAHSALIPIHEWYRDCAHDHEYSKRHHPFGPGWRAGDVGVAFRVPPDHAPGTVRIYEYYNEANADHEYTQRDRPYDANWRSNGVAFFAYPDAREGTVPIHEYYSDSLKDHEYTPRDQPWCKNWRRGDQGVAFYAYQSIETGERVVWIKMTLVNLMSKETPAGEIKFHEEVVTGYTHNVSLNAKFHAEVSLGVEAGLPGFKSEAKTKFGIEVGASYAFSYSSQTKTQKAMCMPAGSPGYIYQATVQARTNEGTVLGWQGGLVMTDKAVDLVQTRHL